MAFFSDEKLKRRNIEIDDSTISCESDEVRSRLNRISENYEKLGDILASVESQIASDERLSAINQTLDDASLADGQQKKKARKWRPRRSQVSSRKRSAGPKKPR